MGYAIKVGDAVYEISEGKINMLFKSPSITKDAEYPPEVVRITAEVTAKHMAGLEKFQPQTKLYARMMWPELYEKCEPTPQDILKEGMGVVHSFGLIDLTLKCIADDVPYAWVYPESHLHPAKQVILGDILTDLWMKGVE